MNRRSLLWTIYPYYLVIIVASLALAGWYASSRMTDLYMHETTVALETRAKLIRRQLADLIASAQADAIQRLTARLGETSGNRLTVIAADGTVLGDSEEDPAVMENHGNRPEISVAYGGEVGVETRYSNTLQTTMIYVAVPVASNGEVIGVVRASQPLTAVQDALNSLYLRFVIAGLLIALLATAVSYLVFVRLTRPLQDIQAGAERFARGDFEDRLPVPNIREMAALSEAMNSMAGQLDNRIRTISRQRNEREAILSSMFEGVIALDAEERITSINRAAAEMFGIDQERAVGFRLYEVARYAPIQELVSRAASTLEVVEEVITLRGTEDRYLQAHGTALVDSAGVRSGLVLVFTDITRLKRLERIRRDFVANVSHELKTPITAIGGSVEALSDGAIDNATDRERFLDMITRHARRLGLLVDDLLSLARLEAEAERGEIPLKRSRLIDAMQGAVQACQQTARERHVEISLSADPEIEVEMQKSHLEQAVINLIDNAIKYSEPGTEVQVSVEIDADEVVVAVTDKGRGIAPKHLPRLFERFYRVDTARSRETGGTGLGLSIVKHIVLAHHGRVSVDSVPGTGSTFRIHLPRQA